MNRRKFIVSAGMAAGFAATSRMSGLAAQARPSAATLARIAIMSLSFQPILKNANAEYADSQLPEGTPKPVRTLDIMDIGQVCADKWGVHNIELQHSHFTSTEPSFLRDFKARLARSRSVVSNINVEFGVLHITAVNANMMPNAGARLQAIDLTKQWIDHAVAMGSPRVMINQGLPSEENKAIAIATLKIMGDYAKTKGIKLGMENRGAVSPSQYPPPAAPRAGGAGRAGAPAPTTPPAPTPPPPAPPPAAGAPLLVEIIKGAGTYANCDIGNFPDQTLQHAGIRLMLPLTGGNTHVKLRPNLFDLPAALKLCKELGYTGLFSIEANANMAPAMGPDPYVNVQTVFDVIVANI